MPTDYQSKSIEGSKSCLTDAEQAWRDSLVILIHAYEAVRGTRGPQHDEADRALCVALKCHEGPFLSEGFVWQWSPCQQSILRHKATAMHPSSSRKR